MIRRLVGMTSDVDGSQQAVKHQGGIGQPIRISNLDAAVGRRESQADPCETAHWSTIRFVANHENAFYIYAVTRLSDRRMIKYNPDAYSRMPHSGPAP